MQEETTREAPDDAHRRGCGCPLCALMGVVGQVAGRHSLFFNHLAKAEIELLKAFKSLIDQRISSLEKADDSNAVSKKATRIDVE
jgi:hypothetical protein